MASVSSSASGVRCCGSRGGEEVGVSDCVCVDET